MARRSKSAPDGGFLLATPPAITLAAVVLLAAAGGYAAGQVGQGTAAGAAPTALAQARASSAVIVPNVSTSTLPALRRLSSQAANPAPRPSQVPGKEPVTTTTSPSKTQPPVQTINKPPPTNPKGGGGGGKIFVE